MINQTCHYPHEILQRVVTINRKEVRRIKLTAKQNKFVEGVVSGLSQSEAYRQAYEVKNMKPETIKVKASNLAKQDNVRVTIEQKQKELADKAIWRREQALKALAKIATADIKDYLSFETVDVEVGTNESTGKPIIAKMQQVTIKNSDEVDGSLIQEVSTGKGGVFKYKLQDKIKAIEQANKMCGYNEAEKQEVTLNGVIKVELIE